MRSIPKLVFICFLCLIVIGTLYLSIVIGCSTLKEFKPMEMEKLIVDNRGKRIVKTGKELSMITWNIGYAGLGKEMDFFYEGGMQVRPSLELSEKYLEGIISYIGSNKSIDFLLLQEVDFRSKRSYYVDQLSVIGKALPDFSSTSAVNYMSDFVPVPLTNPMGEVHSGLGLFSVYNIAEATRIATPGKHAWPKRLFMLNRCFLEARYKTNTGKELVVFNIHNSAFSDEANMRAAELNLLRNLITEEYKKGNFVIAGGDWNQNPPDMNSEKIGNYVSKAVWPIDHGFFPEGWTWAFDPGLPTNRDVDKPFHPAKTTCTIIDYFLVSPNIELMEVKTTDLRFEHSDHHPVTLRFRLMPD
jgi:endonuclease/exonuclease/phosphatase family metal-dependent hydrolase